MLLSPEQEQAAAAERAKMIEEMKKNNDKTLIERQRKAAELERHLAQLTRESGSSRAEVEQMKERLQQVQ